MALVGATLVGMDDLGTRAIARPPAQRRPFHDMRTILGSRRRTAILIVGLGVLVGAVAVGAYVASRPPATQRLAIYTHGRATVAINGAPNTLDLVQGGATLLSQGGAALAWKTADGWYLNLNGPFSFRSGTQAPEPSIAPEESVSIDSTANLQLQGTDFRRWAGFDSRTCAIIYTEVTVTRIAGTISCHGLIWYDASSVASNSQLDLPPFDLHVAFEATGTGRLPAASPS
jgi:hypothetical protein